MYGISSTSHFSGLFLFNLSTYVLSDNKDGQRIEAPKRIDNPLGGSDWQFEISRFQEWFHCPFPQSG
jgi:hypothetical protein